MKSKISKQLKNEAGFSLLELASAVGVVLLLVIVAISTFRNVQETGKQSAVNKAAAEVYDKAFASMLDNDSENSPKDVEKEYNNSSDNVVVNVEEIGVGRISVKASLIGQEQFFAVRTTPTTNGVNDDETIAPDENVPPIVSNEKAKSVFVLKCDAGETFKNIPVYNMRGKGKITMRSVDDPQTVLFETEIGLERSPEEARAEVEATLEAGFNTAKSAYSEEALKNALSMYTGKTYDSEIVFDDYLDYLYVIASLYYTDFDPEKYPSIIEYQVEKAILSTTTTETVQPSLENGVSYEMTVEGAFDTIKGVDSCLEEITEIGETSMVSTITQLGPGITAVPNKIPSTVKSLEKTFQNSTLFNDRNIVGWNTENVTTMSAMFNGATNFDQDVSNWEVSKVVNMSSMFAKASKFNNGGKPLDWTDMSSLQNMRQMFYTYVADYKPSAMAFNQNVDTWHAPNLKDASNLFTSTAFNNGKEAGVGGKLEWNIGQPTTVANMFANNQSFNQNVNSIDTSQATDMSGMFRLASTFNNGQQAGERSSPLLLRTDSATTLIHVLSGALIFNQNVSNQTIDGITYWNTSKVKDFTAVFANNRKFNNGDLLSASNKPLNWNTSSATNMTSMFSSAYYFNQSLASFNTENVTNMTSMFYFAARFNQPLNHFNTSKVESLNYTFQNAQDFNQNLNDWDTSNVTTMASTFSGTQSSSAWAPIEGRPLGYGTRFNNGQPAGQSSAPLTWDMSKVTNTNQMFYRATDFSQTVGR